MGILLEVVGFLLLGVLIGTVVMIRKEKKEKLARLEVYRSGKLLKNLYVTAGESITLQPKSGVALTLRCIHSSWFELIVPEDLSVHIQDKNRVVEI